jgi:hypothetical protein
MPVATVSTTIGSFSAVELRVGCPARTGGRDFRVLGERKPFSMDLNTMKELAF